MKFPKPEQNVKRYEVWFTVNKRILGGRYTRKADALKAICPGSTAWSGYPAYVYDRRFPGQVIATNEDALKAKEAGR